LSEYTSQIYLASTTASK